MTVSLPEYVSSVIKRLEENGFSSYAVGGCVRDSLMKKQPHDYDLCSSATPDEVCRVFSDMNVIKTGIKHGTVTVVSDGNGIEITTFRAESGYSDGRHPDSVSFSKKLSDDLSRRDFTVNALAYSEKEGIIDLFGGQNDINNKTIRCIGDPNERFSEDHLRIFRAVRFASVLGFEIEEGTAEAMLRMKASLKLISPERIAEELKKSLLGDYFEEVFLKYHEIFEVVIPELSPAVGYDQNNPHHSFDLLTHLAKTVTGAPKNTAVRLAALLHDIAKPLTMTIDESGISHYYSHAARGAELVSEILRRLRLSSYETDETVTLVRHHDGFIEETDAAVKRKLSKLGFDRFYLLVSLQRADNSAQTEDPDYRKEHSDALIRIAERLRKEESCVSLSKLAVNGNDMLEIGLSGREIGAALSFLLEAVISGEAENDRQALLKYYSKKYPLS